MCLRLLSPPARPRCARFFPPRAPAAHEHWARACACPGNNAHKEIQAQYEIYVYNNVWQSPRCFHAVGSHGPCTQREAIFHFFISYARGTSAEEMSEISMMLY